MKTYIGRHQVLTDTDVLELALGTPLELWLSEDGESVEESAARLDAARDILADDPDLHDRALRTAATALRDDRTRRLAAIQRTARGPFRRGHDDALAMVLPLRTHRPSGSTFGMGDAA
ncbi:hypothetical protein SLV14_003906 [Streptomyces sp. Je 1-4]|uniref:hypothetical protein n=1 Tax=Streptomyces TaxID=1883 RepID=UPI0021DA35E3|nr:MULTISPECIES: hypothetical protein [unclassified Streptomyces]UYB41192.1 hypothetical protein SLV14_003906 [Streptomyces sp. Je 1-4]UZQ37370.1 hypothetical protein SLV14N_003906 [Streptomyces sp. Je 1-4] [Streptomyces sp. Je 1-4 4N24]UZQ44787.1 hypothetical protein SLV14NA_003906 [Streptomyces sp. Je 1-4] [Streptomyces sp. Je 1-4 4N24_ara]